MTYPSRLAILTALLSHLQISLRNPWHLTLGAHGDFCDSEKRLNRLFAALFFAALPPPSPHVANSRIASRLWLQRLHSHRVLHGYSWDARMRSMDLFLISAIAALFQIERVEGIPRFLWLTISILLALGAIAAKQNGAIRDSPPPLSSLLAAGRGRDFLIASGMFVLVGAILTVIALSVYPYFLDNVLGGVKNGISFSNAINKTFMRTLTFFLFHWHLGSLFH